MRAGAVEKKMSGFIDLHDFAKKSAFLKPLKNIVDPGNKEILENAIILWETKNFEASLEHCFKQKKELNYATINQLIIALNYFSLGKYKDALGLVKTPEIAQNTNQYVRVLSLLLASTIHLKNKKLDLTINLCKEILSLDSTFYHAYFIKGLAYSEKGDHASAIKSFKKSLKSGINTVEIKANLAYSYFKNKNFLKSFWIHKKISPNFENNYKVLYRAGASCLAIGRNKEAFLYFNKSAILNPNFAGVFLTRGYLQLKLGNVFEAKKDLQKAEELGSKKASNILQKYNNPIHRLAS